jgi:hypothetical protein
MAIYIYKYSYHVDWDTAGIGVSYRTIGGGGSIAPAPIDWSLILANYYTKTEMQSYRSSLLHYSNIDWNGMVTVEIVGQSIVTGRLSYIGEIRVQSVVLGSSTVTGVLSNADGVAVGQTAGTTTVTGNLEDNPGPNTYHGTDTDSIKGWYPLVKPFQTATFANPLNIDAITYKDWIVDEVSGSTTINLNNTTDGDAGMLEVIIDSTGGYTITLGTMFTKKMGPIDFDATAGADNIISWRKVGTSNIVYTIAQIEV